VLTSLEAGDWCGHFDAAREEVRESGKDGGQQQSHCGGGPQEEQLLLRVDRHVVQCLRGLHAMTSTTTGFRGALAASRDPCLAEGANAGCMSAEPPHLELFCAAKSSPSTAPQRLEAI
jgi:hypothetical protein